MLPQITDMPAQHPCDRVVGACPERPWTWHVVQTEPWREFQSLPRVSALPGIRAYLPIEVYRRQTLRNGRPVTPRAMEEALRAFLPGHLLVSFDVTGTAWAPLLRRNPDLRTIKLLTDGARPLILPTGYVEALQARGRHGDGAIDLEQRAPVLRPLRAGETVVVRHGPFEGMSAIVDRSSATRVAVMLGMLRVTLDRADVG